MKKGFRFRLYPNLKQKRMILQTIGCCRFVYNSALAHREAAHTKGFFIKYADTSERLTEIKSLPEFSFLQEADDVALRQSLRDLDASYRNFFAKRTKKPRFRRKHDVVQRYRTINRNNMIRIDGKRIHLPKLGWVRFVQTRNIGPIKAVTVESTPTGKFFIAFNSNVNSTPFPNQGGIVGVDVGLKKFCVDSNGNSIDNPKFLGKALRRLAKEQRRLAKKKKDSSNYKKQKKRIAGIYEKVSNQRKDFLQKESTMLIRENQTICVEGLDIKEMLKNHHLAKNVQDASWSMFIQMLKYKAEWYGNDFVKIPRFYPSSQICSVCGSQDSITKNLSVREWECPHCHSALDRDKNAALNILHKGLQMLKKLE